MNQYLSTSNPSVISSVILLVQVFLRHDSCRSLENFLQSLCSTAPPSCIKLHHWGLGYVFPPSLWRLSDLLGILRTCIDARRHQLLCLVLLATLDWICWILFQVDILCSAVIPVVPWRRRLLSVYQGCFIPYFATVNRTWSSQISNTGYEWHGSFPLGSAPASLFSIVDNMEWEFKE